MIDIETAEMFFKLRPLYKTEPNRFFEDILNFHADKWQKEAAYDLANSPKVSIRSGQGVGKTGFEAASLLWFLYSFDYARVVATAPTRQQLNDVLWSEVSKWQSRSQILSKLMLWTKTRISLRGFEQRWFAVARTATKPENMQGFHEDNMLFIVDEASGVADDIMEAILGTLSGENNKLLMCGNPTKTSGVFYDSHNRDKDLYKRHKISSLSSPRTNKENINSLIKKYGESSNVVRVRVNGDFPIDEDDVFITTAIVYKGINTEKCLDNIETIDIGVDVARFGDDNTVIALKVNNTILPLIIHHGYATTQTASDIIYQAKILRKKYKFDKKIYVKIDDTGVGGGVTDIVNGIRKEENLDWLIVIPVNFNMSVNHAYYYDFNTVLWGNLKDLLEQGDISIPSDAELEGELTSRKKEFASNGKIKIETKKQMKERGIQSPDRGDAVALATYPMIEKTALKRKKGGNRR